MKWSAIGFDWDHARSFLAAAEAGSFSGAARELGLTQPTVGRQITALEQVLGVMLFERSGKSLVLTATGLEILDYVRTMGNAANLVALTASGHSQSAEGLVTITVSDLVAACRMPAILAALRETAPQIEIELVVSNEIRDLTRREADIAIRHARPAQPDLIARLVRETNAHLCASTLYLERHGEPRSLADLADAPFIGLGHADRLAALFAPMGLTLGRENFPIVTNNGVSGLEMVKRGIGISLFPKEVIESTAGLRMILPELVSVPFPFWLATHRELQTSRRIRLVFDLLARELERPLLPSPGSSGTRPAHGDT